MAQARKKVEIGYDDGALVSPQAGEAGVGGDAEGTTDSSVAAKAALSAAVPLRDVAVLPSSTDNCAIASRSLEPGLRIDLGEGGEVVLEHTILEGHRFAVSEIAPGGHLTSWGLGFGLATKTIPPGGYCCNDSILEALRARSLQASLPAEGCFENFFDPLPDPARERDVSSPGIVELQASMSGTEFGFQGFMRPGGCGVGTRNYVVLLGTTIHCAPFVRRLERRFRGAAQGNVDGVVAVAHTEGHIAKDTQNWEKLVRCMAGFIVHPNVAACLAVDHPASPVRESIEALFQSDVEKYSGLDSLSLKWIGLESTNSEADIEKAAVLVQEMVGQAQTYTRSWQPAKHLIVAQQCGGSDAFSGVNGNPSSAGAVRRLIAAGGKSLLAETDELIGAESYILARIRDSATEEKYLELRERYHEYARRHGHSAEGNPSGGNKFRGLYNIALKSLGAAMKKPSDVRLEGCLEYGERLVHDYPGYFFMDSPGNDPESIAGQVASGCNVIHFITGNGSITNFPFVPTVKIITTSSRWQLLSEDMDFNAGRLQLGETLDGLSEELFQQTLEVASGKKSAGEKANHWQVCIWRNWLLPADVPEESRRELLDEGEVKEEPLAARSLDNGSAVQPKTWEAYPVATLGSNSKNSGGGAEEASPKTEEDGVVTARALALLLPTSLCSGQVALQIAELLQPEAHRLGYESIVALPHTEGCGCSSGPDQEQIFRNVMLGHLLHPSVRHAVLLEHGCEKTHNDWFRGKIQEAGRDLDAFGWASIQLDGGIEKVTQRVKDILLKGGELQAVRTAVGLADLRIGVAADHKPGKAEGLALASVVGEVVRAGGCVLAPQSNELLVCAEFLDELLEGGSEALRPTMRYAASLLAGTRGFHVMQCPGQLSLVEQVTGLAASGVDIIIALTKGCFVGSPVVPVLQVGCSDSLTLGNETEMKNGSRHADIVLVASDPMAKNAERVWETMLPILSGKKQPKQHGAIGEGNVDFVIPRGLAGISL